MMQEFTIEPPSMLPVLGGIGFALLGLGLACWAFAPLRALRFLRRVSGGTTNQGDYALVRRAARLLLLSRTIFAVCTLSVAWLFLANSFVWFRAVDINQSTVRLHYCWPKCSTDLEATNIASVAERRNRNNRVHLVLETRKKETFRSVATDNPQVISEIKEALNKVDKSLFGDR